MLEGDGPRGRPARWWSDDIADWCSCTLPEAAQLSLDRTEWRNITGLKGPLGPRVLKKTNEFSRCFGSVGWRYNWRHYSRKTFSDSNMTVILTFLLIYDRECTVQFVRRRFGYSTDRLVTCARSIFSSFRRSGSKINCSNKTGSSNSTIVLVSVATFVCFFTRSLMCTTYVAAVLTSLVRQMTAFRDVIIWIQASYLILF